LVTIFVAAVTKGEVSLTNILHGMKRAFIYISLAGFFSGAASCGQPAATSTPGVVNTQQFKDYWYGGKAEISSYHLQQSRYGETREGKAVLIFVTEDFSEKKHVKLDDPAKAANDKVSVLKMNFTKNFVTGIYPYSLMLSVFTPVDRQAFPASLKVSMTGQEWCGHVFAQLNLRGRQYHLQSNSYFEQEGDTHETFARTWLEDELWNVIRLSPKQLPTGTFNIIPGLFFTRLQHAPVAAQPVQATKNTDGQEEVYVVEWANGRSLQIRYEREFPHRITGWVERFSVGENVYQTTAQLDKTIQTDYWTKNRNAFLPMRDSLGLSRKNY
jgi:hypothetical protein